jgi:type I restriction enzyme R subunit
MTPLAPQESAPGHAAGGAGTPEARARRNIDRLLTAAGWHLCGARDENLHATPGVAVREFCIAPRPGELAFALPA